MVVCSVAVIPKFYFTVDVDIYWGNWGGRGNWSLSVSVVL